MTSPSKPGGDNELARAEDASTSPASTPAANVIDSDKAAAEYVRLGKEIERLQAERTAILHAEFERRAGMGIGGRVRETAQNKRGGVIDGWYSTHWPFSSQALPWVRVRLLKKNGEVGEQTTTFFDWKAEGPPTSSPSPEGASTTKPHESTP